MLEMNEEYDVNSTVSAHSVQEEVTEDAKVCIVI